MIANAANQCWHLRWITRAMSPAGILGLIQLIRALDAHPPVGREYQLWLYPVCNPSGYADRTRQSRSGRDLNREFWKNSAEPEVQLLERELRLHRFNGIIVPSL